MSGHAPIDPRGPPPLADGPAALATALQRCHPRVRLVLAARFLEGATTAGLGERFGLSLPAARALVWEAARALSAVLNGQEHPEPLPDEPSARQARALDEALSALPGGLEGPAADEVAPLVRLARGLSARREVVAAALEEADRAWAGDPRRTWELWARRLAIALILAASAAVYWGESSKPKVVRWERR